MEFPHGRVFVPSMLEDDVLRLLAPADVIDGGQNWLMTLVCDVKQQAGLDADADLPYPAAWNTVTAVDDWPVGRLPAVLIIAGGSTEDPERQHDGSYLEPVALEVAIVDSASTLWEAKRNAGIYAASARAAIAQHLLDLPDPTADVAGVLARRFDPRPLSTRDPDRKDTVAAGLVACDVVINNSLTDIVGLTEPPDNPCDPIEEGPTVETVDIRINPDDD